MRPSSSIDKSNLGNAKTDGFTKDLHFAPKQYNLLLTIFFIPLIVFCVPVGLLAKKFGACYVLPAEMVRVSHLCLGNSNSNNNNNGVTDSRPRSSLAP